MELKNIESMHSETRELVRQLVVALEPKAISAWDKTFQNNEKPKFSLDSCDYTVDNFRVSYLWSEILSKYDAFSSSACPKKRAIEMFMEQERKNHITNVRLRADAPTRYLSDIIGLAQANVRKVVGKSVKQHIKWITTSGYFGTGVNVGVGYGLTAQVDKMSGKQTCTKELLPFACSIINSNSLFSLSQVNGQGEASCLTVMPCVSDSKLTTVPKNAEVERVITVEPTLNSFLQGGIGRFLRKRLLRVDIDLRDQTRNQNLAKSGIQDGTATVDLAQASNSLTIGLVHLLMSGTEGLYELLDCARSKRYTLNGTTHEFAMFSGMGNGATFPLESLIFWALTKAVCDYHGSCKPIGIYGDDIIIDADLFNELVYVFQYVGLEVNRKKTHASGPFRESCGAHFYKGVSVKPFYIRSPVNDVQDWIVIHNAIWRWAAQDGLSFDSRVIPILNWIREKHKMKGVCHPDLGDVNFWPLKSVGNPDRLYKQWRYTVKQKLYTFRGPSAAMYTLYSAFNRVEECRIARFSLLDNTKKLHVYSDSPSDFTRRERFTEYKWTRSEYFGYHFPFVIV